MTRETEGRTGLFATVALAAAVTGGMFFLDGPLVSQRPRQQGVTLRTGTPSEIVSARLWQDPLSAIQRHWNDIVAHVGEHNHVPPATPLPRTISGLAADESSDRTQLRLLALMPSGSYADDVEQRRRQRYAIVYALTQRDFKPTDAGKIGYFLAPAFGTRDESAAESEACTPQPPDGRSRCPLPEPPILIGYEVFRNAVDLELDDVSSDASEQATEVPGRWKSVLVLWLNAQDFREYPLHRIQALMAALDGDASASEVPTTVLLGPPSSGDLREMLYDGPGDRRGMALAQDFVERARDYPRDSRYVFLGHEQANSSGRARLGPDAGLTALLVESTDSYLDYGLPPSAAATLSVCLSGPDDFGTCLEPLEGIQDSDPTWIRTLSDLWPEPVQRTIRQVADERAWIESLLVSVHRYLDNGLPELGSGSPEDDPHAVLHDCLTSAHPDAARIGVCLQSSFTVSDSDSQWHSTVAFAWVAVNAAGESSPPTSDVSSIVETIASQRQALHILSTRATVPLDILMKKEGDPYRVSDSSTASDIEDLVNREQLQVSLFRSVIAGDDVVFRDILLELGARGVCSHDRPKIAIISERDTLYGRVADDLVGREADELEGQLGCAIDVLEFGYLRGVDGELPPGSRPPEEPFGTSDDTSSETLAGALLPPEAQREEPFGVAQLDYVRRLADEISFANAADGDSDGFVAIGILGSDVYDKQLILQSLRERLPSATYFTTDLDARLADPDTYSWTRNLIVGSSYGFSVRRLRGPGFRDSYQTALFHAVNLAIDVRDGDAPSAPSPRLFEIGRSGPVEITHCLDACDEPHPIHGQMFAGRGSNSTTRSRLFSLLVVLAPLISLTLIGVIMTVKVDGKQFPVRFRTQVLLSVAGGVSSTGLAVLLWNWPLSRWEPWVPLEGVSSVPTLVLHVTTILFSAWIVAIAIDWIVSGHLKARNEFGLPSTSDQKWRIGDGLDNIPRISTWMKELMVETEPRPPKRIENPWAKYLTRSHWRARLVRIVGPLVLCTGAVIFIVEQEPSPLLTKELDWLITGVRWLTILVVLATVFFCTDTLNLGRAIIRDLSRHDVTGWESCPGSHSQLDPYVSRHRPVAIHPDVAADALSHDAVRGVDLD